MDVNFTSKEIEIIRTTETGLIRSTAWTKLINFKLTTVMFDWKSYSFNEPYQERNLDYKDINRFKSILERKMHE